MGRASGAIDRSPLAALAIAHAERHRRGLGASLKARFGVGEADDPSLPLTTLRALLDAVAAETADPMLGLNLCLRLPRGTYGVLEYSVRSAQTLRQALGLLVRYTSLLNDGMVIELVERNDVATVMQDIAGDPLVLGRHGNEFSIAMIVHNSRLLSRARLRVKSAWFAHPAPGAVERRALSTFLGTSQVAFGAKGNAFTMDRRHLDLPMRSADPHLLAVLDRYGTSLVARSPVAKTTFEEDVRRALTERIHNGSLSLSSVARALGVSSRTLQRRLSELDVGFQELVDDLRRELALAYLRDGALSVSEVAHRLGYSNLRPFLRAFKRWTGMTPRSARSAR
jgi:AraC-like DNA-binding protein